MVYERIFRHIQWSRADFWVNRKADPTGCRWRLPQESATSVQSALRPWSLCGQGGWEARFRLLRPFGFWGCWSQVLISKCAVGICGHFEPKGSQLKYIFEVAGCCIDLWLMMFKHFHLFSRFKDVWLMIANHFQTFSRFGHVRFMIFNCFHNCSYLLVVSGCYSCWEPRTCATTASLRADLAKVLIKATSRGACGSETWAVFLQENGD